MQRNRENQPLVRWRLSARGSVSEVGSVSVPKFVEFFEIADVFLDGVPVALGNQYGPVSVGHVNRSTRNGIKVPASPTGSSGERDAPRVAEFREFPIPLRL